jgi:general secretion pathway protein G
VRIFALPRWATLKVANSITNNNAMKQQLFMRMRRISPPGGRTTLNQLVCHTQANQAGKNHRHIRGFTLLELLVVVVIIGLLAGLVAPRYFESVSKSKTKVARAQIESLDKALDQYRLDVGNYPSAEQGLGALNIQPSGVTKWQGPYLKKALPMDPWDNAYIYVLQAGSGSIDIVSYGADGKPGGTGEAQDISLHSLN